MISWQLSKQGIRSPVSTDRTAGSSVDPSRSSIFWSYPLTNYQFQMILGSSLFFPWFISLRKKRLRLVSEQKKTVEGNVRFWSRKKVNENQKMKEWIGGGGGKEGNACRQTPLLWKPAFACERSTWLARLVKQYWHVSIKGLCHTEMSYITPFPNCLLDLNN